MNSPFEERICSALDLHGMLRCTDPERPQMLADMFAMGCLLHFQGERSAGAALIGQVFEQVKGPATPGYLNALVDNLSGNELRFAREIEPSAPLRTLCDRAQPGPRKEPACAR